MKTLQFDPSGPEQWHVIPLGENVALPDRRAARRILPRSYNSLMTGSAEVATVRRGVKSLRGDDGPVIHIPQG